MIELSFGKKIKGNGGLKDLGSLTTNFMQKSLIILPDILNLILL